jgi:hypothetical protein
VRSNLPKVARNLLLLLALAALLGLLSRRFASAQNGTDFPEFYAAAKMVGEGAGRQLYDPAAQDRFQIRYAGRSGTYFNHPPFEALLYWPLARWPLRGAYLVWCLLNAGFLTVVARLLAPEVFPHRDWRVLLVLFFLFVPVLLNFLQGQDSLLLLLLLSLALAALQREKEFAAGCLLACGLFKFHLVVPLVVVLLARPTARREKRLVSGFLGAAALLVSISAAVSGWGFLSAYPRFLLRLPSLPLAGIHPEEMANLRGLASLFSVPEPARYALILLASLVLLWLALLAQRQATADGGATNKLAFANAILAGVLLGYHLSPHDLSGGCSPRIAMPGWRCRSCCCSPPTIASSGGPCPERPRIAEEKSQGAEDRDRNGRTRPQRQGPGSLEAGRSQEERGQHEPERTHPGPENKHGGRAAGGLAPPALPPELCPGLCDQKHRRQKQQLVVGG